MDIFAHVLWANVGARGANAIADKKSEVSENLPGFVGKTRRKFHMHPGWTAFFGVAPDFFAFTVPFILGVFSIISGKTSFSDFGPHHMRVGGFDLASYLYQFSHSLIIFILVFILVWILSKRPRWELLGWALHILIDIPSHSINFYPTPFLFPISEYRFPYGISWANHVFMIINYSVLAIIWGWILMRKYIKIRSK